MGHIDYGGADCLSFKQIDEMNALPKGSSFRAFKRVREHLREGQDYFYLSAGEHMDTIARLRSAGLVYPGSLHIVLIARSGYERMQKP